MNNIPIRRALISVFDKKGIVEFACELTNIGIEIISTGVTYDILHNAGISVIRISEVTDFTEIFDGRLKTLHPKIHGGILAVRDKESYLNQMKENAILPIDLVVVNFYPFQEKISKLGATYDDAIENIDIVGPTIVRSAAKNHRFVTALVDPVDYRNTVQQIKTFGGTDEEYRKRLAAKAFGYVASYDAVISKYLNKQAGELFPDPLTITFNQRKTLRYGENPHQQVAYYHESLIREGITSMKQLHGKELSFNNINDAHAALEMVNEFQEPAVVVVKHTNPCGVGVGLTVAEAYQKAYESDPVSIFGGIVAMNRPICATTATKLKGIFLEIILSPSFEDEALEILKQKKNLRLLKWDQHKPGPFLKLQTVSGGVLVQETDIALIQPANCEVVTDRKPTAEEWRQLLFAWKVVKHVKSNAIVVAKDFRTVGIGAGQMNRVSSATIALQQAGMQSRGSVLASDAFFSMKDTVEKAVSSGITAIIQPGGSIRYHESIEEANKHDVAMVFTGIHHFKH